MELTPVQTCLARPFSGMSKRRMLALALGLAATFIATVPLRVAAQASEAANYPNRPIRIILGTAPGRSFDTSARMIADGLAKELGQAVVVDNQPGAGGVLGLKNMMTAKPDGYTLFYYWNDLMTLTPWTYQKPPYDPAKDVAHVGGALRTWATPSR